MALLVFCWFLDIFDWYRVRRVVRSDDDVPRDYYGEFLRSGCDPVGAARRAENAELMADGKPPKWSFVYLRDCG